MKIVSRSEFCEDKKAPKKVEVKVGQVYRYSSAAYYLVTAPKGMTQWYIFNLSASVGIRDLHESNKTLQGSLYTLVEATLIIEEDSK